jgi:hypothetical protein
MDKRVLSVPFPECGYNAESINTALERSSVFRAFTKRILKVIALMMRKK